MMSTAPVPTPAVRRVLWLRSKHAAAAFGAASLAEFQSRVLAGLVLLRHIEGLGCLPAVQITLGVDHRFRILSRDLPLDPAGARRWLAEHGAAVWERVQQP